MELELTGRNIELSPEICRYVERKLGKLGRYLPNITGSRLEISEGKTRSPQQRFVAQVTVDCGGTLLRGEERGKALFAAIDKVAATMSRQIEHYKGRRYSKGKGNPSVRGEFGGGVVVQPAQEVVKVKRFVVKPMSVTEAIGQMELLGHDFFLFFNADTEGLNLLYRRKDSNYGLIEPELD